MTAYHWPAFQSYGLCFDGRTTKTNGLCAHTKLADAMGGPALSALELLPARAGSKVRQIAIVASLRSYSPVYNALSFQQHFAALTIRLYALHDAI